MRMTKQHGTSVAPALPAAERERATRVSRGLVNAKAASGELTREINRNLILERIRALQPISRVDLARASGLQPSTVSSIVEQLLGERWVRESAILKTARGRHPTMLSLSEDLVILTADVRPRQAVVALVDLYGRFWARQVVPLGADPHQTVESIANVMQRFREQHPSKTFEGVGISMPGRVDAASNQLIAAPNLPWRDFDLGRALAEKLKLQVQMDNAANACLLSELWYGRLEGVRNAVLLTISEGIGGAILAEGRLITGAQGMAGEFGHICMDPEGPVCGCGARGCWEMYASSRALWRHYKELVPDAERKTAAEIVSMAIDGDSSASEALRRQAEAIGKGLHIVNATLSPDLILFAGDVTAFWDLSLDILRQACKNSVMAGDGPMLRSIGDGEMARLRGAAAVVLRRHAGYYQSARKRPSTA